MLKYIFLSSGFIIDLKSNFFWLRSEKFILSEYEMTMLSCLVPFWSKIIIFSCKTDSSLKAVFLDSKRWICFIEQFFKINSLKGL